MYAEFPDLSIERFAIDHVGDDDNGWFLMLAGAGEDLQIESHEGGQPPFSLESDADSIFRESDVPTVVTTLSQWLRALAMLVVRHFQMTPSQARARMRTACG